MVNNYQEVIEGLHQKIKSLMQIYDQEKTLRIQISKEKSDFESELKRKEIEIEELQKKVERLMLGTAFMGTGENSHEAKIKINRIVREIDNCIALLNR